MIEAANGLVGYARALEYQPDCIVIDWAMPVMDGRSASQRIHDDPYTAQIPIVMLTTQTAALERASAFAAGVGDFLGKPVVPSALTSAIRHRLDERSAKKAATPPS